MSSISTKSSNTSSSEDDNTNNNELRRGPWTVEEDTILTHYIACHGEGRWNLLAKHSGLKRTGKSCRLRWLNYLKPDVKRGNLTPEEQLLILDLHSKWGNRWSKIAQYLPGRTDNEIKNYWRTRVQKHAKHLKIDAESAAFQDIIRRFWMPRLIQKIEGSMPSTSLTPPIGHSQTIPAPIDNDPQAQATNPTDSEPMSAATHPSLPSEYTTSPFHQQMVNNNNSGFLEGYDMDVFGFSHTHAGVSEPHAGCCHVAGGDWANSDFFATLWTEDELWQHRT